MTPNTTLCPHPTPPLSPQPKVPDFGCRQARLMFLTQTKDVFTMSEEHLLGMLWLSGRKSCEGFVLVPGEGERERKSDRERRKQDTQRKEKKLCIMMPANRFDPVFLLWFFVCFGENGGQCIAELNCVVCSLAQKCPSVFFIFSLMTKKKKKQRLCVLAAHYSQVEKCGYKKVDIINQTE